MFTIIDGILKSYKGTEQNLVLPEGVTEIASFVFDEGNSYFSHYIQTIQLPQSLKKIGAFAFRNCTKLESIDIPDSVEVIENNAFEGCSSLCSVKLPAELSEIAGSLFSRCHALKTIDLPASVTKIGRAAFANCNLLESFVFPPQVTQIKDCTFSFCTSIPRIDIPAQITEISDGAFYEFGGTLHVVPDHPVYSSEDGALYRDGGKTLMYLPPQETNICIIPQQAENITGFVLQKSYPWNKVILHSNIRTIESEAIMARNICAPLDAHPEKVGKNIFNFPSGTGPLFQYELPVDYVREEALRRRLALGFCLESDKYDAAYAANYEEYIKQHLSELKRMADKQKLPAAQKHLEKFLQEQPPEAVDYTSLKPVEKVELLERTVIHGDVTQVENVMKGCKSFEFTARALGIACRYRSLDMVKVLVENGATFEYEEGPGFKTHYATTYKSRFGSVSYKAEYELLLLDIYMNISIVGAHGTAKDVHFGGMPLISLPANAAEQRAEIAEYLHQKGILNSSVLFYALLWKNRLIAERLLNCGARLDGKCLQALENNEDRGAIMRSEWLCTLPCLPLPDFSFAFENYCKLAEHAGIKVALPQSLFEEHKKLMLTRDILTLVVAHADLKKLSKTKLLEATVVQNDVPALNVLLEANWLTQKASMEKLIQLATDHSCHETAAWLMNYMNQHVDVAKEAEKAEKKAMRELMANPASVTELKKIWLYKKLEDGTLQITAYKGSATEIEIPEKIGKDAVSSIGEYAFHPIWQLGSKARNCEACKALEKVTIPDSVREIGERAFENCAALKQVTLPADIKIGERAFSGCAGLQDDAGFVIINQKLTGYWGSHTHITVPDGVTELAEYAFSGCAALTSVELPSTLLSIGRDCFSGTAIQSLFIPGSVQHVDPRAFDSMKNLTDLWLPDSADQLSDYFNYSRTEKVNLHVTRSTNLIYTRVWKTCTTQVFDYPASGKPEDLK